MHECSASIGVVLFDGKEADRDEIIRYADGAMYFAKNSGRNQVRFHAEES